jgi:feruloyl esterase
MILAWVASLQTVTSGGSCADLTALALSNGKITRAETVEGGIPPGQRGATKPLPAYCRVAMTLTPSSDSDIKVEVWIPAANWNGKYQAVGNGAFNGTISYPAMATALARGYATSSTDTGHVGGGASWAPGHPEKVVDFGWRAVHEMTVASKTIIASHAGRAPAFAYWNGCSAGGRQAMKEAQRFPGDFNGIIAGAPGLDWIGRAAQAVRIARTLEHNEAARLSASDRQVLHRAVLEACDASDGLKDGLITDPRTCHFDPSVLLCKNADGPSCLTAPQVKAAKQIYSPAKNPRTGKELFSSFVPGTELGWGVQAQGPEPAANIYDQYKYVVFKDPNWDWKTFNFDSDVERGNQPENLIMNATDPDMRRFFSHGGKLLLYHGWSDPQVPTLNTIKYYNSVVDVMGGAAKASSSVRFFLEPGMGHCGGGEGPSVFDKVGALEQWVEHGKAPDTIIASHTKDGKIDRTRPLCPYPQVAKYKGTGSIDDAANFACAAP